MRYPSIPVLGYHRVGAVDGPNLSLSVPAFTRQMAFLAQAGYRTVTMAEYHAHVTGRRPIRERAVLITFDDGLRDVMLNAGPVLARHRFRATVFVITDRAGDRPRGEYRPDWDFNRSHAAAWQGDERQFLEQSELQRMVASGVFEVHAHSARHRQVFVEPRLIGVYPESDAHWGVVSAYGGGTLVGTWPVFPRASALVTPAFEPRLAVIRAACDRLGSWRDFLQRWPDRRVPVDWFDREEPAAWRSRVLEELQRARATIAGLHPGSVAAMCWPWGAWSTASDELAREAGFDLAFRTSTGANVPGSDPFAGHRLAVRRASVPRLALGLWIRRIPGLAAFYGRVHRRW